jgi:cephalosporin hydroxylase
MADKPAEIPILWKGGYDMRKGKFPVVSIVLYVLAALFALYAIWAAIYSINYVSDMVAANQLVIKGSEFEVANFLMSNIAQYVFFAIVLFGLGRIVQVISFDIDDEEYDEEDEDEEALFEEISDEDAEDADEADTEETEQSKDE